MQLKNELFEAYVAQMQIKHQPASITHRAVGQAGGAPLSPHRLKSETGKRALNRFTDNPEHTRTPLLLTPNVAVPPLLLLLPPYQRSRNNKPPFCQKQEEITERRSDSGNRQQPLQEPSRQEPLAESCSRCKARGKHHLKDKTSADGHPSRLYIYIYKYPYKYIYTYKCVHEKEILRKIQGRGCLQSGERRKRAIYYHNEENPAKKGKTST